jgi:hypothetical protein
VTVDLGAEILTEGGIIITHELKTITGSGISETELKADYSIKPFLFEVVDGSLKITLLTLTLTPSETSSNLILFSSELGLLEVKDVEIKGDTSSGSIIVVSAGNLFSVDGLTVNNFLFSDSSIISIKKTSVLIENSNINNISRSVGNGAVINAVASFDKTVTIDSSTFTNVSLSSGNGSAIYIRIEMRGKVIITNSVFTSTSCDETNGYGGALFLYLEDHVYEFYLSDLTFDETSSAFGRHVYVDMDNITSVAGGQFAGLKYMFFFS